MLENLLISLENVFNSSPLMGLGASFLAGMLIILSPCVYPLIPITLGVVGAVSSTSRLKSFYVSLVFVLGICFIYTVLGVISSIFGILFGMVFINPITYFVLMLIFFTLGASQLEVIKFKIPVFTNHNYQAKKGFFSLFILGIISGLAIIPCSFPVLGAILSLISTTKNIFYGGLSLFLFSLGYGTILIILGTFTGLIRKLPKQGLWLVAIKKGLGLIFLAMGVYFLLKFTALLP